MKSLFLLTIIFLTTSMGAFAQDDFRDGFIINLEKDTIHGQLDYRSNAKNYLSARFKKDNVVTEYGPQQISGFGYVGDKAFTSNALADYFVEILIGGELSLYKFSTFYMVRRQNEELHKLEVKTKKMENGSVGYSKDNKWKGILVALMDDCLLNMQQRVVSLAFREKDLTELVVEYNQCKGSEYTVYKENKRWARSSLGLAVGLNRSSVNVVAPRASLSYLNEAYNSVDPFIGIVLEVSSPRISEKVSFQTELQFSRVKYSALVVKKSSSGSSYHESHIDLATLSMPFTFKYSVPVGKSFIYFQGGFNYDYHIEGNSRLLSEIEILGVVETLPESPAFDLNRHQFGLFAGLGVSRSFQNYRGGIAVRYIDMPKLSKSSGIEVNYNKLALTIIISSK